MKKSFPKLFVLAVGVFAMFAISSCEGFAPTVKVPVTSEAEFDLTPLKDASSLALLHQWDFNQDINALVEEYGGDPEKIKESNVKSVTITLLGDNEIDLSSIFNSIQLKIDQIPAAQEELVAETAEITANSITFNIVKGDIFNYTLGEEGFSFLLYGDVNWNNVMQVIDFKVTVESELVVEIL